jgi:hypothetical protein
MVPSWPGGDGISYEYVTIDRTAVVATDNATREVLGVEISDGAPGGIGRAEARLLGRLWADANRPRVRPTVSCWLVKVPIR